MKTKSVIYARVSTKEQAENFSLESQVKAAIEAHVVGLERENEKLRESVNREFCILKARFDRLNDAFLDGTISKDVYREQSARIAESRKLASDRLLLVADVDVKRVLFEAEQVCEQPERFWLEGTLEERIALQTILFPAGVTFDGEGFKASEDGLFELLKKTCAEIPTFCNELSNMATHIGGMWNRVFGMMSDLGKNAIARKAPTNRTA